MSVSDRAGLAHSLSRIIFGEMVNCTFAAAPNGFIMSNGMPAIRAEGEHRVRKVRLWEFRRIAFT